QGRHPVNLIAVNVPFVANVRLCSENDLSTALPRIDAMLPIASLIHIYDIPTGTAAALMVRPPTTPVGKLHGTKWSQARSQFTSCLVGSRLSFNDIFDTLLILACEYFFHDRCIFVVLRLSKPPLPSVVV